MLHCRNAFWVFMPMLLLQQRALHAHTQEIRLGGAIALSGKYASNGIACQRGWTFWAERLNARGGIRLQNGSVAHIVLPLDLRDDGSSAANSEQILSQMLDPTSTHFASLNFVIGPFSSGITKGNAKVAQQARRIIFSHGASESLYDSGNPYIFSVLTPGRQYMTSGLQLLHSQGARSVVFAHEAKSFSRSVCQGANATAHELGMHIGGYFEYEPGKTNFADIVFDIKKANPDIYVMCGHLDDVTFLIGNANTLNVNPKAVLVTHAADSRIVRNVGRPKSHGLFSPTQWDQDLNYKDEGFFGSAKEFHGDFEERFGSAPPYSAAYAAAMGYALQKAIETAGTLDTDPVRTALQELRIDSFYGTIEFSGPGDPSGLHGTMPRRAMVTTQIQNGSISVVAPAAASSRMPIYPVPTWSEKALQLHPCPLGSYEAGLDSNGDHVCSKCPSGKYQDYKHFLECSPCKPGSFAAAPGAIACELCPAGTWAGQEQAINCTKCPQGSFCSEGSAMPRLCPAGRFCTSGTSLPEPCPSGTYRMEEGAANISECLPCVKGRFNDKVGAADCAECSPGRYNGHVGQRDCERCGFNFYQQRPGQGNCTSCPGSFVTWISSADSVDACICDEHMFLNRRKKECISCPEGAVCPGGLTVPFLKEGFYAQHAGDPSKPMGSELAFSGLLVWECPKPAKNFCPGQNIPNPERPDERILNVRMPDECPPHHQGISCALCESGYRLQDGHCRPCGIHSGLKFAVMIILLVIAEVLMCKYMAQQSLIASAGSSIMSCSLSTSLTFMQILAVLTTLNFSFPEDMEQFAQWFQIFILDAKYILADCIFSSFFAAQFAAQVTIPLVIIGIFFLIWAASVVLDRLSRQRWRRMNFDDVFNACASTVVALYIPISKIALRYFECRAHAAARTTLLAYPAVECQSQEHHELLPLGVAATVFYIIGIFTFMFCTILSMPWLVQNEHMRRRFRFIYSSWRPDRWFWGMLYMVRDLLITLVVIVAPNAVTLQCALILSVLLLSITALASFQPWRETQNNNIDLCITGCLCVILILSFKFICQSTGPVQDETENAIVFIMSFLVVGALVFFSILVAYALNLKRTRQKQEQIYTETLKCVALAYVEVGKSLAHVNATTLAEVLANCPSTEVRTMERSLVLMGSKQRKNAESTVSRHEATSTVSVDAANDPSPTNRRPTNRRTTLSRMFTLPRTVRKSLLSMPSSRLTSSSGDTPRQSVDRKKVQLREQRLTGIFNWEEKVARLSHAQHLEEEEEREAERLRQSWRNSFSSSSRLSWLSGLPARLSSRVSSRLSGTENSRQCEANEQSEQAGEFADASHLQKSGTGSLTTTSTSSGNIFSKSSAPSLRLHGISAL